MITKFRLFAASLAGALVCSVAGAQIHNGTSANRAAPNHLRAGGRASATSTSHSAAGFRSSPQSSVIQISPNGLVTSAFAFPANTFSLDNFSGVPGLGFDFPHLAAISGVLQSNIDHFGHSHFGNDGHRGQGSIVPIWFSGYPYYGYEDTGYDQQEQQPAQQAQTQPQIIVIQQPVPAQQNADSRTDAGAYSATVPDSQPDAPIRDVGDFILVRRDGRILFASIFSVVGAQLQYVTPEGIRRTLAMSDLDRDATQQMNEARGTTVQIQN